MNKLLGYDQLFILVHHIPLIQLRLDRLISLTYDSSPFHQKLYKDGISYLDYVAKYVDSIEKSQSKPFFKVSKEFMSFFSQSILQPYQDLSYILEWFFSASFQLSSNGIGSLDLRANQLITISFIKIFVMFLKITIFFKKFFPLISSLIVFSTRTEYHVLDDYKKYDQLLPKLHSFTLKWKNQVIMSFQNCQINNKLISLALTILPYLSNYVSQQSSIDWELFSIFSPPLSHMQSTLPPTEYLIYSNFSLFRDFFVLYCLVYDELIQDQIFILNVFTSLFFESPVVYLSRTYFTSLISFLPQTFSFRSLPKTLSIRLSHIFVFLRDLVDISSYDHEQLAQSLQSALALSGLSYYELNIFLSNTILLSKLNSKIQKLTPICETEFTDPRQIKIQEGKIKKLNLIKEIVSSIKNITSSKNEIIKILDYMVKLHKQMILSTSSTTNDIQRFYLYNLSTIDAEYLSSLIEAFPPPKNNTFHSSIKSISDSLNQLNLEDFDNGERLDFTPLLLTIGRLIYHANIHPKISISTKFEHLTTIYYHCIFVEDPLGYFRSIFNLYDFTNYFSQFKALINDENILLENTSCLLELESLIPNCSTNNFGSIIQDKINKYIFQLIDDSSLINQIGGIKNYNFSTNHFALPSTFSKDEMKLHLKFKNKQVSLELFFDEISHSLSLDNQLMRFFRENISNGINSFIHPKSSSPQLIFRRTAALYHTIWPIMNSLNVSFNKNLFDYMHYQSSLDIPSFLSQFRQLDRSDKEKEFSDPNLQIIYDFDQVLTEFLQGGYFTTLYFPPLHGFYRIGMDEKYFSQFFTRRTLKTTFSIFGPDASFVYLRRINYQIGDLIVKIFNFYINPEFKSSLRIFKQNYDKTGVLPSSNEIENMKEIFGCFTSLGVALTLKNIVQESTLELLEENVPGIANILKSTVERELHKKTVLNNKERLIIELTGFDHHNMFFIRKIIQKQLGQKDTDISMFFFFCALLFASDFAKDCKCYPQHEAVEKNLHLIPLVLSCFVDIISELFLSSKETILVNCILEFIKIVTVIMEKHPERKEAYIFILSLLPKYMPFFHFGRLNEAYPRFSSVYLGFQQ